MKAVFVGYFLEPMISEFDGCVRNTEAVFYNKDLFDKFGIDYPTDNMTWDEMYELSKNMTRSDGDIQYYGYLYMAINNIFFPTSTSKHLESVFLTIDAIMSEESQLLRSKNGTPSLLSDSRIAEVFGESVAALQGKNRSGLLPKLYANKPLYNEYTAAALGSLRSKYELMLSEGKDMNTVLREAEEEANQKIEEILSGK